MRIYRIDTVVPCTSFHLRTTARKNVKTKHLFNLQNLQIYLN